jgi:cytochrome c peroxidase
LAAALGSALLLGQLTAQPTEVFPKPKLYRLTIDASFPEPTFPADNPLTEEGVELGRRLFFDPGLSLNGQVSCASCHRPEAAFSDSNRFSRGIGETRRNSMPLFNLAWRRNFFWDGRANTIREQVVHPLTDAKEMGADVDALAGKLGKDPKYAPLFKAAFCTTNVTSATIALALEQFLMVQISQDSKFDKVRRGEDSFTEEEQRGLQLFFTEYDPGRGQKGADCFHCHGNVLFTNERFANNGLETTDTDTGRYETSRKVYEKWCFKVPSLRNVALTAPYMHDGRFKSLEEVVDHYDHGVHESETLDASIAKHGGSIQLSQDDKKALVAFLRTLTDEKFIAKARALDPQTSIPASKR